MEGKPAEKAPFTSELDDSEMTEHIDEHGKATGTEASCPLFMTGLPSDFSTNNQLKAIASLMKDDDEDEDDTRKESEAHRMPQEAHVASKGDGKVTSRRNAQEKSRILPHKKTKNSKHKRKSEASVNEAHLFLKMWNLSESK